MELADVGELPVRQRNLEKDRMHERGFLIASCGASLPVNGRKLRLLSLAPFTTLPRTRSDDVPCQAEMPEAKLLSIRGYRFGFSRELSPETAALVEQAVETLRRWLNLVD